MDGVRQGSVLGPLFFLIFINVIKHCQIRMFGDDTLIFIDADNRVRSAEHLEEDLRAIRGWEKTWHVTFRPHPPKLKR